MVRPTWDGSLTEPTVSIDFRPGLKLNNPMAANVSTADSQSSQGISMPSTRTLNQATQIVFTPIVGVAMETSPFSKARKVSTWPLKKATATRSGCHNRESSMGGPSSGSRARKSIAVTIFTTKLVRQIPTRKLVARLSSSIATTKVTLLKSGNSR